MPPGRTLYRPTFGGRKVDVVVVFSFDSQSFPLPALGNKLLPKVLIVFRVRVYEPRLSCLTFDVYIATYI